MNRHDLPQLASIIRGVCIVIWLGLIATCLTVYLSDPGAFTAEHIASFLSRFQGEIWVAYILVSTLRGFTLLPSTPLVIAGTILFPTQPVAVLIVSLMGIILSSALIYFFSDKLGFRGFFEKHGTARMEKIRSRLEHGSGIAFVAVWSFFPFVPTDLVCYVAGTVRMHFGKFITAVFIGELVLCSLYVHLGNSLANYFR